ncbi:MAG TPA: NAD(P)-dependent alcohol dehydrogenase, partial [Anaeromyxobacteraceae bacterium]|nr:NAD(P)-dependent alcohol dehydrogenase [Anaeromyxobacteraceae bacterium]
MARTRAYAAKDPKSPLVPFEIDRRPVGPDDVAISIEFCGICHSDIHQARDEWGGSIFPMVPGHEIVGRVTQVGPEVKRFKVGDRVGVGCMVDSCRTCPSCQKDLEQFCQKQAAYTYNGTEMDRKTPTYGGYSTDVVVRERFVVSIPAGLDPAGAAPLLCAGITTYSPLRHWNVKAGDEVAVVGLGGLGHMAVKIAAAMGAKVTMLSTSKSKEADARRLGATGFALTTDKATFKKLAGKFDFILDTSSANHDIAGYRGML